MFSVSRTQKPARIRTVNAEDGVVWCLPMALPLERPESSARPRIERAEHSDATLLPSGVEGQKTPVCEHSIDGTHERRGTRCWRFAKTAGRPGDGFAKLARPPDSNTTKLAPRDARFCLSGEV
jgi:hypothetical protein